jgi:leucyl/phenylalanyl-tRNA--protein transferase
VFPPADTADEYGLVGLGADLEPGTVLAAYTLGLFPMPIRRRGPLGWWSPDPRGILELDELRITRSMRQAARHFEIRVDTAFAEVIRACADPRRPNGWIDARITAAYEELHALGWAHSVEAWDAEDRLVGGLYGVSIGAFFAGESMFHQARDASKVALMALVDILRNVADPAAVVLDVQWCTPHLASLGAREIPRRKYLQRVATALGRPGPWDVGDGTEHRAG